MYHTGTSQTATSHDALAEEHVKCQQQNISPDQPDEARGSRSSCDCHFCNVPRGICSHMIGDGLCRCLRLAWATSLAEYYSSMIYNVVYELPTHMNRLQSMSLTGMLHARRLMDHLESPPTTHINMCIQPCINNTARLMTPTPDWSN